MSRLQVGGLAFDLESGETCKLLSYFGDGFDSSGKLWMDNWLVEFNNEQKCTLTGESSNTLYQQSKFLMPLGDKQTKDELAKEKELEHG